MDLRKLERVIGDSGLSIGTHLTMENIFPIPRYDEEKELANPIDLNDYTYFIFNFYTLVRNIYNSYTEKDKFSIIKHMDFHYIIEEEIDVLQSYFSNFKKTKFVIYRPDYSKVIKNLNMGKEGKPSAKYEEYVFLDKYMDKFIKSNTIISNAVDNCKHILPKMEGDVIVMTHYSVDLLNKGRLHLIESHTGKLKSKKDFYTKFHTLGVRDLSYIPFMEETYYIFGDTQFIRPLPVPIRRAVLAMGMEKNWTYKTSEGLIKMQLSSDPDTRDVFRNFKSVY